MSYASLRPPEPEVFDESDENSIQGSPLLDTGSQFDPRPPAGSVNGPVSGAYTYVEPYDHAANYRDEASSWRPGSAGNYAGISHGGSAPTGPYEGPPSGVTAPSGPIAGGAAKAPTGPPSGPYEGPYDEIYANPAGPYEGSDASTSEDLQSGSSRPRPASTFDPRVAARQPQSISQVKNSRLSLPTRLAYPEESEAPSSVPSPHATLQFGTRQARPYSALLRDSLAPGKQASIAEADDDDDALPFETTTQQSAQNRPLSAIHLSQMSTGMVMSKDKFESYRKSLSSLDLLKREGSIISRIGSTRRQDNNDDADDDDGNAVEEDVEDEFLSSEKERKRKLAKERQKQEARMSVYRQRMTKMIGGNPPSTHAAESRALSAIFPSNDVEEDGGENADDDEDDDDDLMDNIPLGILQAHGFPRNRRKSLGGVSTASPAMRAPASANTAPTSPQTPPVSDSRPQSVASSRMFARPVSLPPKPAPMSNVFENKDAFVSRGLVAEIAREEDLRRRRNTLAVHNAHGGVTTSPSLAAGAVDLNAKQQQTVSSGGDANLRELNSKIDALFDLLKDRGSQEFPRPGSIMGSVPGSGPLGEHMANIRAVSHRPESINSYVTTPYAPSIPETSYYSPSQVVPNTPGTRASYAYQHVAPPPPQSNMGTPLGTHMGPTGPPHIMAPAQMGVGGARAGYPVAQPGVPLQSQSVPVGTEARLNNRPSRMRLVATEDDEEDDEAEMQKLLHKRQALRAQWREQATTT